MTAKEILGMDSNATMAIGISALQRLLKTLKAYKTMALSCEDQINNMDMIIFEQKREIASLKADLIEKDNQIEQLKAQTFILRCIDDIDVEQL